MIGSIETAYNNILLNVLMLSLKTYSRLLREGFNNSYCIFCWSLRLQTFCRGQNISSSPSHFSAQLPNLCSYLRWATERNGALRTKAPPERDVLPVQFFQMIRAVFFASGCTLSYTSSPISIRSGSISTTLPHI